MKFHGNHWNGSRVLGFRGTKELTGRQIETNSRNFLPLCCQTKVFLESNLILVLAHLLPDMTLIAPECVLQFQTKSHCSSEHFRTVPNPDL
jgi:hypothetical protein